MTTEDRHRYLFGLADPDHAAAHGYDKSAGRGAPPKPPAPQLSDSAYAVMNGTQRGARDGRAPDATSEAHERSERDSRVVAVLAAWSACMEKSGYGGIRTPYDVVEEAGLADDKGGPRAVTAARADVACKSEVNLVGVRAAVEKAYQERLVEEHAETLALYGRQREARFRLAASVA
ncbi:hypothetical protein [Streptomyces sp. H27-S2]|uniref:hypothetical protein n=1 Tax=Streptomyces antarcticus TaxID=2996458 RepID=UPI00226DCC8C|nr:hypothetical protein [Streptomyces sp. H27-S2]MCY0953561.1 hypothetical protein [Streptomyces sp. H27-S2]